MGKRSENQRRRQRERAIAFQRKRAEERLEEETRKRERELEVQTREVERRIAEEREAVHILQLQLMNQEVLKNAQELSLYDNVEFPDFSELNEVAEALGRIEEPAGSISQQDLPKAQATVAKLPVIHLQECIVPEDTVTSVSDLASTSEDPPATSKSEKSKELHSQEVVVREPRAGHTETVDHIPDYESHRGGEAQKLTDITIPEVENVRALTKPTTLDRQPIRPQQLATAPAPRRYRIKEWSKTRKVIVVTGKSRGREFWADSPPVVVIKPAEPSSVVHTNTLKLQTNETEKLRPWDPFEGLTLDDIKENRRRGKKRSSKQTNSKGSSDRASTTRDPLSVRREPGVLAQLNDGPSAKRAKLHVPETEPADNEGKRRYALAKLKKTCTDHQRTR